MRAGLRDDESWENGFQKKSTINRYTNQYTYIKITVFFKNKSN
jgi:hypothetical protein